MEWYPQRQPGGVCEWCKKPAQPTDPVDEYSEWRFLIYLHQRCVQAVTQQTQLQKLTPTGRPPEAARESQERLFQDSSRRQQQASALSDRDLDEGPTRVAATEIIAGWMPSNSRNPKKRNLFQKVVDTYDTWKQNVDPTRVSPRSWRQTKNRPPLAEDDMDKDSNEKDQLSAPVGH